MSAQISVPDDVKAVLDKMAKARGCSVPEAATFMIGVAVSRLNALKNYANKGKEPAKPVKKVAAKKVAKKVAKAA